MLTHRITASIKALRTDPGAAWALAGLSFGYGVFHAAGPGHGKAVVASYVLANERALRRGLVLAVLAAMLQAAVAIAMVGILALVFNATAARMNDAAVLVEQVSYAGLATLGLWLLWRKGAAFSRAWRAAPALTWAAPTAGPGDAGLAVEASEPAGRSAFSCAVKGTPETPVCAHGIGLRDHACNHVHAPDPQTLGEGFSWGGAALTVVSAGARPCSGAILVLVFALSQDAFPAGVAATLAMALGTCLTTGGLAVLAVLFKDAALRLAGAQSRRGLLLARGLEVAAALVILAFGVLLLAGVSGIGSIA